MSQDSNPFSIQNDTSAFQVNEGLLVSEIADYVAPPPSSAKLQVKNNGSWCEVKDVHYFSKETEKWAAVKEVWVKTDGSWSNIFKP